MLGVEISVRALASLGAELSGRSESSGRMADVVNAIRCQRLAIEYTSDADPIKAILLNDLGNSYHRRFTYSKELADLTKAIEYNSQAVSFTFDGHPKKTGMLSNLASRYIHRFEYLGEHSDCEKALQYLEKADSLAPNGHESRPVILCNLGALYLTQFERLGKHADLSRAIAYQIEALSNLSDDHIYVAKLLSMLSGSYHNKFKHSNDVDDLNNALDYRNQEISRLPVWHPGRLDALRALAGLNLARFEHFGDVSDIDKATNWYNQVLSLASDDKNKSGALHDLGTSYQIRFQHLGILPDLETAIEYQSQAASLALDGGENKGMILNGLGNSYQCRFVRLGAIEDIDKAINYFRLAAALVPKIDGHPLGPSVLANSANSHSLRFDRLGDISDANKAIDYLGQAISLTPDIDASKRDRLNGLGLAYLGRYKDRWDLADVNNAIMHLSQAVSLTRKNHVEKPRVLGNLGRSYYLRFERQGGRSDINKAIDCLNEAVRLTSSNHSHKPARIAALGDAYELRFEHFYDPKDHDQAINCQVTSVSLFPDGHANKSESLLELARLCIYPTPHPDLPVEIKSKLAVACYRQAAQSQIGNPNTRFMASHAWARTDSLDVDSRELAYQTTMELLPQLVWLGTTIDRRYKIIKELGDIATEAVSFAISYGIYEKALEWLEAARSIVWNQILHLRTPLEDLSAIDPELANRLESVGRELEHAGSRLKATSSAIGGGRNLEEDAESHRNLAAEWVGLINQARAIPGMHDFMRPRAGKSFLDAAKDGPVVVINVHPSRCDALILRPGHGEIAHVALKSFSIDKAVSARVKMMSLLGNRGERARGLKLANPTSSPKETFKDMLTALWVDVVKPVLDFLGYTRKGQADELPHVTWCTTGPLSFLPLHAAGCYDGIQPNTFDLVVSSYTPTLSALLASISEKSSSHTGILAVGQEHTKGLCNLLNTVPELAAIKRHATSTCYLQLDGENATVNSVLDAMSQHSWVHLACHATQNGQKPSMSAFHLSDGSLALATITRRSFRNKGLAFLSACQTAAGDDKLPDEAVHLAAGMLMAGYPSVIATMWSINDADAPEVAERVYAELLKDGSMDHRGAGRALHGAVAALREKVGEQSFLRWVPFIHMGM